MALTGKQSPCTYRSGKGLRSPWAGLGPPATRRRGRGRDRKAQATEEAGRGSRGWGESRSQAGKQHQLPPRSWEGQGRTSPGAPEGAQPAATLISDLGLQDWGRINFHCSGLHGSQWTGLASQGAWGHLCWRPREAHGMQTPGPAPGPCTQFWGGAALVSCSGQGGLQDPSRGRRPPWSPWGRV